MGSPEGWTPSMGSREGWTPYRWAARNVQDALRWAAEGPDSRSMGSPKGPDYDWPKQYSVFSVRR